MERRPIRLMVDIIPFKEKLELILEGGTIANVSCSKQVIKLGHIPSKHVQISFVHKETKKIARDKNDGSDDEEDEEEMHEQNIIKTPTPVQVKQHSLYTSEENVQQNANQELCNNENGRTTSPSKIDNSGPVSTVKNITPVKDSKPVPNTAVTPIVPNSPVMSTVDKSTCKTSTSENPPSKMDTSFNLPNGHIEKVGSDAFEKSMEVEELKNDNIVTPTENKRAEIVEKPKRKRGRPFKKDSKKEPDIPNKRAKPDNNVKTRSSSISGDADISNESPKKEDMSKFVKKEVIENSLPDFVCQLCGFRLDQERYVQKHVKLRHAGEWHRSVKDGRQSMEGQIQTSKDETVAPGSSKKQGHNTRSRRSSIKESRLSVGDAATSTDQGECKTPNSKGNDRDLEFGSPTLSKMNECSLCGKNFPSRQAFHMHIETVHHIPVESRIPHYTCGKCQCEFVQLSTYETHMLNVHSNCNKLSCTVEGCGAKVNTPAGLKRHIARKHRSNTPSKTPSKSPSKATNTPTKPEGTSKIEVQTPTQESKGPEAKKEEGVKEDMVAERPKLARPECKVCGKKFISNLNLKRHEDSCTEEKLISSSPQALADQTSVRKSPVLIRDNNNTVSLEEKHRIDALKFDDLAKKVPQVQLTDIVHDVSKLNALHTGQENVLAEHMAMKDEAKIMQKSIPSPLKWSESSNPMDKMPRLSQLLQKGPEASPPLNDVSEPINNVTKPPHHYSPVQAPPQQDASMNVPSPHASPASQDNSPKPARLQCSKCNMKFISQMNLQRHEKYAHTSGAGSPQTCPFPNCGKNFGNPIGLKGHIDRVHNTDKQQYACDQCPKAFGTITSLRAHVKTVHQKIKDIVCPWQDCGKTFGRSSHLDNHMKRHRGEMNFGCQYCDYRCIQRASLNYHMRHSHPDLPYCRQATKVKPPSTGESPSHSPALSHASALSPANVSQETLMSSIASDVSFDKM